MIFGLVRIIILLIISIVLDISLFEGLAFAYIDPGSGMPFFSSGSLVIGILLAFFGSCLIFAKRFFSLFRKFFLGFSIILLVISVIIILGVIMSKPKVFSKKVVVLGMDALDPNIMEQLMEEGKLPNFVRLKEQGSYSHLATVNPPESPVAWASIACGVYPGKHGLFDFIIRDPETYKLKSALTDVSAQARTINIGKITIPIGGQPRAVKPLRGRAFWKITSEKKVPTVILCCPGTFPPDAVCGRMLSGMGVPDIRGTQGIYSFYTTINQPGQKDVSGKVVYVEPRGNVIQTALYGPLNRLDGDVKESAIPMKIVIDRQNSQIEIRIQKQQFNLKAGQWSKWQRLTFKMSYFRSVSGICRFYLKSLSPELELYCSAVNFNPEKPVFPISYPGSYSRTLAKTIGLFHTQGMPYDTWALSNNRIDEAVFLQLAETILKERKDIFKLELSRFKAGVLFSYFEFLDPIQHMFWRFRDEKHPFYNPEQPQRYKDVIENCYKKMDGLLGIVLEGIDKQTALIVCSDHGFNSFRYEVHLNSWLRENGFLYLKNNGLEAGREFFEDVDWTRTKAYSLGFGGIYINQAGREGKGIIKHEEQEGLKRLISAKLLQWQNEDTGEAIVKNVHRKEHIFNGPFSNEAPDLFVGFNLGYRASWQTALGGAPDRLFEPHLQKWSGDHIFDASLVPGVVFMNRRIKKEKPHLIDIAPTILDLLGLARPEEMDGHSLLE